MRKRQFLQSLLLTLNTMISHEFSSSNSSSSCVTHNPRRPADAIQASISSPAQEHSDHLSNPSHNALHGFPLHFTKGSRIQLASGKIKNIEDLEITDFIESAELCPEVSLEHSTVVRLEKIQTTGLFLLSFSVGKNRAEVTISASPEHPFFVYGHGWSSCAPSLTLARYSLNCMQLRLGDACVSLARRK